MRLVRFVIFFVLACCAAQAQTVSSCADLVRAMHDRYAKTWYQTLTFTQKSTTYNPDGTSKAETWYEALSMPAKLRIDIGPPAEGKGYLLVDGKVHIYRDNKLANTRDQQNMLLVLGFDVYAQPPDKTLGIAKAEGYDTQKFHEDTWKGEPSYVCGAEKGDLKSTQFWVEKKRLLFTRLFEPGQGDPKGVQEVRFEDYRPLLGGWVSARVEVYNGDKLVFSEDYTDIQGNPKLDPAVFDPEKFASTHWEK